MTAERTRLALVVRGGWEGHDPIRATDLFIPHLREHGFDVAVADSPAAYLRDMSGVDLIVQCLTLGAIGPAEFEALETAVRAGTGLAGWHGGLVDSYRECSAYLQMVGGQFAAHPGPDGGQAVPHSITVTPAGRQHPITADVADFDLVTEQYWVLTDAHTEVLATTTHAFAEGGAWSSPVVAPAIWTRQWGRGRIFVATPGHSTEVLSHPDVRTVIERGLLWAARGREQ